MTGTVLFISSFSGAEAWAKARGLENLLVADSLDLDIVEKGDTVIVNLPVDDIAEINRIGATYAHLSFSSEPDIPCDEMSADEMNKRGAQLRTFFVSTPDFSKVDSNVGQWDPVSGEHGPELEYQIHSKISIQGAALKLKGDDAPPRDVYLERIKNAWRINISMDLVDVDSVVTLNDDGDIEFADFRENLSRSMA
jgi:putative CRISPR-associated protein (TIGR02620 family)